MGGRFERGAGVSGDTPAGYFCQKFARSGQEGEDWATGGDSVSGMLVGEKLTGAGKVWRLDIYERLHNEQEIKQGLQATIRTQNGMWWMTLTILALMLLPFFQEALRILWWTFQK